MRKGAQNNSSNVGSDAALEDAFDGRSNDALQAAP